MIYKTGMFDGSKRDAIIVHVGEEESTPQPASEVEDSQVVDVPHPGINNLNKVPADSVYSNKNKDAIDDMKQKISPRRKLIKRASLPVIRTEFFKDKAMIVEDPPRLETVEIPDSPSLRKAETIGDLSLDNHSCHLEAFSSSDIDSKEFLFPEGENMDECRSPLGQVPSPSPSQISFDALSLTTSGFSEADSNQVSTGDLNVGYDINLNMDPTANGKSVDAAWRSQSDPSHGIQLENTVAELQAHRNSNSEPNLSGEKLKEESEQLAKRVNGGNQAEITRKTCVPDDDNDDDDDKESELSPDDGCYELDRPERHIKSVKRANSAPELATSSSARAQRIANSIAVEKTQVKLNKLAAMETIIEVPNAEPAAQMPEKVKLEQIRSSSLEGSCTSPMSGGMAKEEKRKPSLPKEQGKPQKSKHVSIKKYYMVLYLCMLKSPRQLFLFIFSHHCTHAIVSLISCSE